ncbi:hypothetical protein FQN55_007888 [Onygenales sp. PD_40]|nr:hypothetical protein FQN55_007888 [Onygenales sp. PD_40]KAK2772351.1 hypothetical protein FQN53_004617 [Emmonsiellopsis sp. PD_33]KAK2790916.1 hypothetical protein FQN52_005361 [Onygenales sp. PD_12]KAK2806094.1 hypothetical protein FQN51_008047 [Onygenales sp. PD_10]
MGGKDPIRRPSPAALPASLPQTPPARESLTTVLLVNNVHCASCVAYAKEVLFLLPHIQTVDVSILTHEVRISHGPQIATTELAKALIDAAFEVCHASSFNGSGTQLHDTDISWSATPWIDRGIWPSSTSHASSSRVDKGNRSRKTAHIENCDSCRIEEEQMVRRLSRKPPGRHSSWHSGWQQLSPTEDGFAIPMSNFDSKPRDLEVYRPPSGAQTTIPDIEKEPVPAEEEYDAYISVSGMTCAACVGTVTNAIQQLEFVKSANVALLTHSASVTFRGPRQNVDKILSLIDDLGFEGTLDEVSLKSPLPDLYLATASIGGMTCGACVGTITRALDKLTFVTNVTIDLLGASGKIEFEGRDKLDEIVERVEDLGYDITVTECVAQGADEKGDNGPTERTISIKVDGMFCRHCPQTVLAALESLEDGSIEIEEEPTLKKPIVTLSYKPDPPFMTVRNIIAAIEAANDAFKTSIYHPPSIEDRSRKMQIHERRRLLIRLLFTFIVAIPTFLIGIVWMSLVPPTDKTRLFFEQPIWAGSVSRLEWALFITTTPVMLFGADVFHVRAFKEIRALWRPGSKVPILRRFYRFGSMNLLISAGTSVAYFASIAVLVVGAKSKGHESHTQTYFDTVVFLTMFILAGRALEAYSKAKTGDAVAMLGKLRPSEALLVVESLPNNPDGSSESSLQRVSVDLLEVGDTVNIPHGASPPADGFITGTGAYKFDESSLTGESMPVSKTTGDKVYSGSVNVGQPVYVRISDIGSTSMLDQIVAVVREGQTKRAPVERVADVMTGYFVPIITLIAIVTWVIWLSLGLSGILPDDYLDSAQGGWPFWSLKFAIAVFVVACPCGLALAAPTALFVGGGLAAKRGILVRGGGEAFQEASRLDAIVFDKTGTLTEGGTLRVSDHEMLVLDPKEQQVAWIMARVLEESSTHPIARAIADFCADKPSASIVSSSITEIPGQGLKGEFTVSIKNTASPEQLADLKYEAAIGNQRLFESLVDQESNTSYYLSTTLTKYQSAGKSTAILAIRNLTIPSSDFIPAIIFATSDPIRAEAAHVISELKSRHLDVYMCTGDNTTTAHAVASTIGIPPSNVMANVLPTQKADFIRKIQDNHLNNNTKGGKPKPKTIVAFAGDGTNDSPALAAADVSIAMASGSDVAVSSAGFILLNSDLSTILELCTLSRRVFRRVKMNFVWAAVYNVLLVPVAAGVFFPIVTGHRTVAHGMAEGGHGMVVPTHWRLDPVWASLAMALSSVSVVCSSLALKIEWRVIKGWFGKGKK